jgi:Cu(I)/Ag(I) efflux system membrane fusion protein
MKAFHWLGLLLLGVGLVIAGCSGSPSEKSKQAQEATRVQNNLAKLSPEDRKLAEKQKVCPVTGETLGEMGPPTKIEVGGQPVFLCCSDCREKALADTGKTLSKVKQTRSQ